jgi:hypothetical protein
LIKKIIYFYSNIIDVMMTIDSTRPFLLVLLIGHTTDALLRSPLKQIAFTRALQTSVTEAIALNVFDQTSLIKEVSCGCNDYPKIAMYVAGFVVFGFISLQNNEDNVQRLDQMRDDQRSGRSGDNAGRGSPLDALDFYRKSKRMIRFVILFLLVIFNKGVENAF